MCFRERQKGFYSIFEALSNHVLECHPWAVDGIGGQEPNQPKLYLAAVDLKARKVQGPKADVKYWM